MAAEHLHKGEAVLIDGRLNLEQWEDRDGTKRSKLVVIAEHFTFLPNGEAEPGRGPEQRTPETTRQPEPARAAQGRPHRADNQPDQSESSDPKMTTCPSDLIVALGTLRICLSDGNIDAHQAERIR